MSWLRSSPLRQSFTRNSSGNSSNNNSSNSGNNVISNLLNKQRQIDTNASTTDCDPRACYDSFCKHWQQAYDIILRSEPQKPPSHDDVLGVVSHLDYMVTLLLVELHNCNKITLSNQQPPAPCLEYLLSENLLDKLYEWSTQTGRYSEAVRMEQLKLYELLVSHSRHQLLCHEPFLKPLLKILASSEGEIFKPDVEKRLVILLNQLCVVLMQNVHLLDLFFFSSNQHGQSGNNSTNFIIFSLLIPFVHREGSIGHQARDALLLCMALSQKNSNVGTYIAKYSSMCPLLVTGLGGLYSRLPSIIEINSIDWYRITPDDVTEIPELTLFMNSLEFCNAVVQVAHDLIKEQLLDFMYQGFIVPVLGPSVLQIFKETTNLQTNIESQISTIAYLDLILRSVTEPGLLRAFVKFLLDDDKFDGQRILDVLIERLTTTDPNLFMVTISLFDTLLGLYCEDIALELFLKFLLPGKHIPISSRHKINKINPYINYINFFLELTPDVMKYSHKSIRNKSDNAAQQQNLNTPIQKINIGIQPQPIVSKTIGANWNHYGLNSTVENISLYGNFHAYLFDAHFKINQSTLACKQWSNSYRYQKWPKNGQGQQYYDKLTDMIRNFFVEFSLCPSDSGTNSGYPINVVDAQIYDSDKNKFDSLQSIGESSGYESFKWRPNEEDGESNHGQNQVNNELDEAINSGQQNKNFSGSKTEPNWRISVRKDLSFLDLDFSEDLFAQGTVNLGPFLNALWNKLQTFTSNSFYVNLHLTGLITRLTYLPLPLVHSLLLRPDIVTIQDTPSFHQVIRMIKQQIDVELPSTEESLELIDLARSLLIDREFRLINARKNAADILKNHLPGTKNSLPISYNNQTTYANISSTTPPQVMASSSYDPFKRNDTKRKSFSKSITNIFSRKSNSSPFSLNLNTTNSGIINSQSTSSSLPTNTSTTSFTILQNQQTQSTGLNQIRESNITSQQSQPASLSSLNSSQSSLSTIIGTTSLSTAIGSGSGPNSLESMSSLGAIANSGTERTRDLALCAVLLDEWLKELAAISQEQSIVMLNEIL